MRVYTTQVTKTRFLSSIAEEIIKEWGAKINPVAKPYVSAMRSLSTVEDYYGMDSGKSIVLYFLANASTWRGDAARRIKAELKALVGTV